MRIPARLLATALFLATLGTQAAAAQGTLRASA